MDMDLDIKIDPDLLQIRLRSAHRYQNPIQIHFKPIQIRSNWIWITWIFDQIQSIVIPSIQPNLVRNKDDNEGKREKRRQGVAGFNDKNENGLGSHCKNNKIEGVN